MGPTTTSIGSPVAIPTATSRTNPVMDRAWPGSDRDSEVLPWPIGSTTMDSLLIDALDRAILAELRHDGRATWRELGERVGLGPTATADRVRRLERHGVIRGYHADIDPVAVGLTITAYVAIAPQPRKPAQRLVERLGWPYVAASADAPLPPGPEWIETQWQRARMPSMISKSTRARIVSQRYSSSESVPSV